MQDECIDEDTKGRQEKPIKDLFNKYQALIPVKSRRSERGDLISYFHERINIERGKQFKPIQLKYMAYLLSIFPTEYLYILRMKCDKAKNFTPTFWYYVKPKSTAKSTTKSTIPKK